MIIVGCNTVDRGIVVARIAELEHELFGVGAWSRDAVGQELDAFARTYLLAVDDADHTAIHGYAGFWYDGDDAELMTIGVERDCQRQGVATRLLAALIDQARAQGARRMLLEVRVDNGPALRLYERHGFRRMGLRKRYYQPEGVDAYTMALDLAPRTVGFQGAAAAPQRNQEENAHE